MTEPNMIVLSGLAGAGKDSLADVLVEEHRYRKFSLSDKMKRFCEDVFGWSEDQLWGPSKFRNEPDPKLARPCPLCEGTGQMVFEVMGVQSPAVCVTCGGSLINDNSPRRVLQLLGDEWGRQMIHPDIWTRTNRQSLQSLMNLEERVVVVDARFQNDRNNLHEWFGAKRIHVVNTLMKPESNKETWRAHGSENDQPSSDDMDMAFIINEAWPFPSMSKLVEGMLGAL